MTTKTTRRTLYVHVVLNGAMFSTNFIYCSICSRLSHCQAFSQVLLQLSMLPATAKCNVDRWITRMTSTSTVTNGVKLAHHIFETSMVTFRFYCIFLNSACREHSVKVSKKLYRPLLFVRNHLKLKSKEFLAVRKHAKLQVGLVWKTTGASLEDKTTFSQKNPAYL